MSEFLDMGGYAPYVWSSFGFGAATIVFNIISARRRLRITLAGLAVRVARRKERLDTSRRSGS
jgi:heme exporter protein CcmD